MNHGRGTGMRRLLLDELVVHVDDVVAEIGRLLTDMPPYAGLGPTEASEVLQGSVRWTVTTVAGCLRDGRRLARSERVHLEGIGASRRRQDIPLPVVTHVFRSTVEVCSDELTRLARDRLDPLALEALVDLLRDLKGLADTAEDALAAGYGADSPTASEPQPAGRTRLVDRVLTGRLDDGEIERVGAALGWQPGDQCVLVAAVPTDDQFGVHLHRVANDLAAALPAGVAGPVLAIPSPFAVALASLPDGRQEALNRALDDFARRHAVLLVATPATTLEEVAEAFGWLRHEIGVARVVRSEAGVVPIGELARHVTVAGIPVGFARWFVGQVLGPLFGLRQGQWRPLLDTLEVLAEPGVDRKVAAERLCLSVSGLRDRIVRIERLTGLTLGRPGEAWLLLHASWLVRHHPDAWPAPVDHLVNSDGVGRKTPTRRR